MAGGGWEVKIRETDLSGAAEKNFMHTFKKEKANVDRIQARDEAGY